MVDLRRRSVSPVCLGALVFSAAIFIRLAISRHPYSGAGKPPMFGDYEAQRHWMEITYNLPLSDWYVNSSKNDLNYWGLDYPPLTAYHSWVGGVVAARLNPDWVALNDSRGYESYEHKLYMRYTVIVVDILVFFTAVLCYVSKLGCGQQMSRVAGSNPGMRLVHKAIFSLLLLLQPSLVLIDHGHFQYNCVSLGLALWGVLGVLTSHDVLGSIAFSLALNYKQMELYHAMPFFFFLLGKAVHRSRNQRNVNEIDWMKVCSTIMKLGLTVVLVFAACWMPFFVTGGLDGVVQVLKRLFPFGRGLYEDKVANVWCSISVVVKMRQLFSQAFLIKLSFVVTVVALLPSSIGLLHKPTPYNFLLALVNSSLSFFLFSFQVHEKSILLATLPVSLLTAHRPYFSAWFNLVAAFSMYPLLVKDGLALATWSLSCLFIFTSFLVLPSYHVSQRPHWIKRLVVCGSTVLLLALCLLSHVIPPPLRLPDIFSVLISACSCALFLISYLYCNWLQLFAGSRHSPNLQLQLHGDSSFINGGYLFGGGDMYWSTRTSIRVSPPLGTEKQHVD